MPPSPPATGPNYALMGFLAAAIAVLGMLGLMATFVAPLPLERALRHEAALDDAAAAVIGKDPAAAIAALGPRLGDNAAAVLPKPGDSPDQMMARINDRRAAQRALLLAQSQEVGARLRLMIAVCTVMAAGFGALAVHASRRRG